MEKRLILAIAFSSFILLIWSFMAPKPAPMPSAPAAAALTASQAPSSLPLLPAISDEKTPVPGTLAHFKNEKIEVVFDEGKAAIKEIIFKKYQSYKFSLAQGLAIGSGFKQAGSSPESISFISVDNNKQITKKFIFSNSNYSIELETEIKNLSSAPANFSLPLYLGTIDFNTDPVQARNFEFSVYAADKLLHPNPHKDNIYNSFKFIGLRDRYFTIIIAPPASGYSAFIKKQGNKESMIGLSSQDFILGPGQALQQKFLIYAGPQEIALIKQVNPDWTLIVHFGTFDIISQMLLKLLEVFYTITHNWGVAIIVLSIAVYFMLYPLSAKQMRSMREMQALQPRIEELRKAYKDNPQKLNKEIMELYREHKVNPLSGCLPLILQMPLFFALYQALMRSISLKGARFLWIKDLSEPDRLFVLPHNLPILGNAINLLPLLMMIGMFVQQKLTMSSSASANNEQQKIMLIVFPLMFGFIFYSMPSGLVLYWFVNSILMLIFQLKVNKAK